MRKPFDVLAERLILKKSRGDKVADTEERSKVKTGVFAKSERPMTPNEQQAMRAGMFPRPKNILPPIYAESKKTPLRWRVPDDGKKTLELSGKER